MADRRRLSESISEGDGISILVEVASGEVSPGSLDAAVGLLVPAELASGVADVPIVVRGGSPTDAAAVRAAAWLLVAEDAHALAEDYAQAGELGLECIVEIHDEDELEEVLVAVDPEIVLLAPSEEDGSPSEAVLALLPDVPAGKLAIGALPQATEEELVALERAGVDAVVIDAEHAATLFQS